MGGFCLLVELHRSRVCVQPCLSKPQYKEGQKEPIPHWPGPGGSALLTLILMNLLGQETPRLEVERAATVTVVHYTVDFKWGLQSLFYPHFTQ